MNFWIGWNTETIFNCIFHGKCTFINLLKGRFRGYGTVESCHKNNESSSLDGKNDSFHSLGKWSVTGYFQKGNRRGFCTIITNDIELKGHYNKLGELDGFGTISYLEKGKCLY